MELENKEMPSSEENSFLSFLRFCKIIYTFIFAPSFLFIEFVTFRLGLDIETHIYNLTTLFFVIYGILSCKRIIDGRKSVSNVFFALLPITVVFITIVAYSIASFLK